MLLDPVVTFLPASNPKKLLNEPVHRFVPELYPIAVFDAPVVSASKDAPPTAVFVVADAVVRVKLPAAAPINVLFVPKL